MPTTLKRWMIPEIYCYDDSRGLYVDKGEIIIEIQCESMLPEISSYEVGEVVDHIRRRTYIDRSEFERSRYNQRKEWAA